MGYRCVKVTILFHHLQGSSKLAEFTVPAMIGRWSKFAIGVSGSDISLYVYCHNYTSISVERDIEELRFTDDSLLLVGHAGDVIQQPYKVSRY